MEAKHTRAAALAIVLAVAACNDKHDVDVNVSSPDPFVSGYVTKWEARWVTARACLLAPVGPAGVGVVTDDVGELIAVHTLAGHAVDPQRCTHEVAAMLHAEKPKPAPAAVRIAWTEIDRATADLGSLDELADAVRRIDAADASLRAAAGLAATTRDSARLAAAPLQRLAIGSDAVTEVDDDTLPSSDTEVIGATTALGDRVDLVLAPGTAAVVLRSALGVSRSASDPTWGVIAIEDQLRFGAIAADGVQTVAASLPAQGVTEISGAIGGATTGTVPFVIDGELRFARITGTGADAPNGGPVASLIADTAHASGGALAWSDAAGALHGRFVTTTGATPAPALALGTGAPAAVCVAAGRAWLTTQAAALIALPATGPAAAPIAIPDLTLRACTGDGAILGTAAGGYALCGATCRAVNLAPVHAAVIATATGGQLIVLGASDGVLAVIPEHGAVRYFAVPAGFVPLRAASNGAVIAVLGRSPTGVAIATVPVSPVL